MTQRAKSQGTTWPVEEAYRHCERLARTHYENFTVGSLLMPRPLRRHMYALYAYCRTVDDLGDEAVRGAANPHLTPEHPAQSGPGDDPGGYRLALLDWWESELDACYEGEPSHPVHVALKETIHEFDLPREPFQRLIEANRMDQRAQRYPTYGDLLHYCEHSANPVGRLVLYLFGYGDEERQRMSDATCTALQLANFWQDVARDYREGADLHSAGGHGDLRVHGEGAGGRGGEPGLPRADGVRGGAGGRVVPGRGSPWPEH